MATKSPSLEPSTPGIWSSPKGPFFFERSTNERRRIQPVEEQDMPYTLNINGKSQTVDVPGDMPLLWALRDVLDLRGTKFGCGLGQCGACTVHLRGNAVRSCQTTVAAAAGAAITTIEGLSPDASHPLQRAWVELDVPQCGYCQAGQLM